MAVQYITRLTFTFLFIFKYFDARFTFYSIFNLLFQRAPSDRQKALCIFKANDLAN